VLIGPIQVSLVWLLALSVAVHNRPIFLGWVFTSEVKNKNFLLNSFEIKAVQWFVTDHSICRIKEMFGEYKMIDPALYDSALS
jgi:hypothetical protein